MHESLSPPCLGLGWASCSRLLMLETDMGSPWVQGGWLLSQQPPKENYVKASCGAAGHLTFLRVIVSLPAPRTEPLAGCHPALTSAPGSPAPGPTPNLLPLIPAPAPGDEQSHCACISQTAQQRRAGSPGSVTPPPGAPPPRLFWPLEK